MFLENNGIFDTRQVLATTDPDEARATVGRHLQNHDLRFLGGERLESRMNQLEFGSVSIFYLQYGAHVLVDPGAFEDFYIVHINLGGACEVSLGRNTVTVAGQRALVCPLGLPTRFRWQPESRVLGIKISRTALETLYQELTGLPLQRRIDLDLDLDMGSAVGRRLISLIRYIDEDARHADGLCSTPRGAAQMERLVMTTILLGQTGSHHDLVNPPVSPAAPHYVRRAEAFMLENLDRGLTLDELSAHTGVSSRSLTNGFRDFRGASPMAYFANLRLERAHEELRQHDTRQTVTSVANRWGFEHLSSFASLYRRRFGVSPAETLRRG